MLSKLQKEERMPIAQRIFKQYDIRGIWNKDLTAEVAYLIGKAIGSTFMDAGVSTIVVGRDTRTHGPEIQEQFLRGLTEVGCSARVLGVVSSPMTYASWYQLESEGSVIITASHNPGEYNGFKAGLRKKHFTTQMYQDLYKRILENSFYTPLKPGVVEEATLTEGYVSKIVQDIHLSRPIKVVLDCGNGATGGTTDRILKEIGCEVTALFTDHDGSFPNHLPYPQKEDGYTELKKKVLETGADLGIAMDGDGDRFGVYDEKGQFVSNDLIGALIGMSIAPAHPGFHAVFNISTSHRAISFLESIGAHVTLWKTGYPHIISKMAELDAMLGNEIAGHFFLRDRYYGFDDATYAAARFIELLSTQEKTVSELVNAMPYFVGTSEFRVPCVDEPDRNKFTIAASIAEELKTRFPEAEILDFDGVRVTFDDQSWLLLRNSNTEPLITGRVEAKDETRLKELQDLIVELLNKHEVALDWENPIPGH